MANKKPINLHIDSELWHSAKVEATKQNKTLQEYVTEALQEKLGRLTCQSQTPTTNQE